MRAADRTIPGVAAAFLAIQLGIIALAANGPFVDESLYIAAGLRVLEGHGLADGYIAWFNGSPFVWPVSPRSAITSRGSPARGRWRRSCPR